MYLVAAFRQVGTDSANRLATEPTGQAGMVSSRLSITWCLPLNQLTNFDQWRSLVIVSTVRFFLEVAGIWRAFDFAADGAGKFLDLAETFVLADKS